ncbi:MAG: hypothetical protein RL497_3138 [Pseudomonadota bacterium]|jgi:hypothetical protein
MAAGYAKFTQNSQTDATVQPEVISWMEKHAWQESHFFWHEARRCTGAGTGGGGSGVNPCRFPEMKPEQNECTGAQDGYEFLVMHRHMIQSLKQLWPKHSAQFDGWTKFPAKTDYPDILQQFFNPWTSANTTNAALADGIDGMTKEAVLQRWPTEGAFGQWIQCTGSGLHGALHFNGYPRNNQAHSVANQRRNLDSFLFWKLHGWIDNVWEKYRSKVGLTPTEPTLKKELIAQCREMDFWASKIDPNAVKPDVQVVLPKEAGVFHEKVRPALERAGCATCHGAGEDADLRLGFEISSTDIVKRLVNVDARNAQAFKLVLPGDPEHSWLYLKASGGSKTTTVVCSTGGTACKSAMPPGGGTGMTKAELEALYNWIKSGATAPTIL